MSDEKKTHTPEQIRAISEKVYRIQLARDAGGLDPEWRAAAADRQIQQYNEKGEDGQARFSRNAGQYDKLTRTYLDVLGIEPE